jgi:hypothetical protein
MERTPGIETNPTLINVLSVGANGPQTHTLIAESAVMLEILDFVGRIAASQAATILLDGELASRPGRNTSNFPRAM